MRKLVLLGALVLPLLGAGVSQAAETADLPANCTTSSVAIECQGGVALFDVLDYLVSSLTLSGTPQ